MRIYLSVLFFLCAAPCLATTYHVATTGSDSNSCTAAQSPSTPKKTINAGMSCLSGSDTLQISAGTYAEVIDNLPGSTHIPSGSAGAPTLVQANGGTVLLQPSSAGSPNHVIEVANSSYVTFDGISVDATGTLPASNASSTCVKFDINATNLIWKNATCTNAGNGIQFAPQDNTGLAGSNSAINCTVHDVGATPITSLPAHGFYVSSTNNLIDGCTIYNTQGFGIHSFLSGSDNTVNNNVYRNNIIHDNNLGTGHPFNGGILIDGNNNQVYNNVVYNVQCGGGSGGTGGVGIIVDYGSVNTQVYNNTTYNNCGYGLAVNNNHNPPSGTILKNNIVFMNGTVGIFDTGTGTVNQFNQLTNPSFVNAGVGNFHLNSGSTAIHSAANLTSLGIVGLDTDQAGVPRPGGTAACPGNANCWDIGAFQFVGAVQNTTTALVSSVNPSSFQQTVTFTATVTPAVSGTPTGNVTFKGSSTTLSTQPLNGSAVAILTISNLSVATHSITATYNGDSMYNGSVSSAVNQVVNQASTTTTLVSSINPSVVGQIVQFTATIAGAFGGTTTGSVTFKDGVTSIGVGTVSGNSAAFSTSSLALGSHSITAVYGGDTNYTTSTSNTVNQVVNPGSPQTYYVSNSGSDSNTCTQAKSSSTPKQNFNGTNGVIFCLAAGQGDKVIVVNGTYNESLINNIPSGASGLPTTIQAQNQRGATLAGNIVINSDNVTFDGIVVNKSGIGQLVDYANRSNFTFKNGSVLNATGTINSSHCIFGQNGAANLTIVNNIIGPCNGGTGSRDAGIFVFGANALIDGNTISSTSGSGIYAYNQGLGGNNNATIRNNDISSSKCSGIYWSDGSGGLFYNNKVYSNGTDSGCSNNMNGIWVQVSGNSFYNNTIYNNPAVGIKVDSPFTATIQNNISYLNPTVAISGGTTVSNNTTTNPNFVNPPTDFHLQPGSAAIGAGLNLSGLGIPGLTFDFAGNSRPATGPWTNGVYNFIAATLTFTTQPSSTQAGMTMSPSVVVTDSDSTFVGIVTLTISACGAGATGLTATASSGVATFASIVPSGSGIGCTFTASAAGANNNVSSLFTITPPPPPKGTAGRLRIK